MRLALIANAASGGGLEPTDLTRSIEALGAEVDAFAIADARSLGGGYDRIAVAGGDGSIGLAAELAGARDVPLAVIPAGTANDFARAHELPLDHRDAVRLAVGGKELDRLELGRLGDRPFVNVASAGLAPEAARHAQGYKKLLGPLAYLVGAARAGLGSQPIACRVTVDGASEPLYEGESWQLIVSVSGAFGGGSSIDEADPGDGRLHVTVVPAGSRLKLAWRAIGMRRGDLADQGGVIDAEGTRIELGLAPDAQLNVDGELCTPAPLSVEPRAFSLVVG